MVNGLFVTHHDTVQAVADRAALLLDSIAPAVGRLDGGASLDAGGAVAAVLDGQEAAVGAMAGTEAYHVVHLLGAGGCDGLVASMALLRGAIATRWPTVGIREWVVHLVERDWDPDERSVADAVRSADDAAVVLVVGSAGEASPAHTHEEMAAMAADTIVSLFGTPIGHRLREGGSRTWSVGATSTVYRRRAVAEAVGALLGWRYLRDTLLGRRPANDVSSGLGRTWAGRLEIDSPDVRVLLGQTPDGGHVSNRLRMETIELDRIAIEAWPDRIISYRDHLLRNRLPKVEEQVEANLLDRLERVVADAEAAVTDVFTSAGQPGIIDQAEAFCDGAAEHLEVLRRRLADERDLLAADKTDMTGPLRRLEHAIRHLPYRAAALARSLVVAVVAAVIVISLVRAAADGLSSLALVLSALGCVLVAASGIWKVAGAWRMVLRRRRELLAAIDRYLRWVVDHAMLSAHIELLDRVIAHLGPPDASPAPEVDQDQGAAPAPSIRARLARLRLSATAASTALEARQRTRAEPGLGATRFAISLPVPADEATEAIESRVPAASRDRALEDIVAALFRHGWAPSSDQMVRACLDAAVVHVDSTLPRDLSEVLGQPATHQRAVGLLGQPAGSLVRFDQLAASETVVLRRLAICGDRTGGAGRVLESAVTGPDGRPQPGLNFDGGSVDLDDPDMVIAIHVRATDALLADGGGS